MSATAQRDVVILGAGFSRAISGNMPDANTLGREACRLAARKGYGSFFRSRQFSTSAPFEIWLSQLAQDLPYLSDRENRQNETYFVTLRDAITEVVVDRQQKALRRRAPAWLYQLLSVWNEQQAIVITLNYDTIVESGVESHFLWPVRARTALPKLRSMASAFEQQENAKVHASDILLGQPAAAQGIDHEPVPSFRLIKLHGSVDWWRQYNDLGGAPLLRSGPVCRFGQVLSLPDEWRKTVLPGRERFIVPPLAAKAPYYTAPLVQQLWQDAYEAIVNARRLTLIGYSLPLTDLVVAGMVEAAMRSWAPPVPVDVVDLNPAPIVERVEALGGGNANPYSGKKCVAEYTIEACKRASAEVVAGIKQSQPPPGEPAAVIVTWYGGALTEVSFNVAKVQRRQDSTAVLVVDPDNRGAVKAPEGQPTVDSFRSSLDEVRELQVRTPSGALLPIVGARHANYRYANTLHALRLLAAGVSKA